MLLKHNYTLEYTVNGIRLTLKNIFCIEIFDSKNIVCYNINNDKKEERNRKMLTKIIIIGVIIIGLGICVGIWALLRAAGEADREMENWEWLHEYHNPKQQ